MACQGIYSNTYSDINIFSDIYSEFLPCTLFDICILSASLSGIYCGIFSGILSGIYSGICSNILSGILSDIYFGILSGILSYILFRPSLCSGPDVTRLLHPVDFLGLISKKATWYKPYLLAFFLAYLLTFLLAFYLVCLRRVFVVEVRRGTLCSWACCSGAGTAAI